MLDVNQVISPTFAVRAGGVFQDAGVAGRNYTTDDRDGGFVATTWKPVDAVKVTADYVHTDLHGIAGFRRAVLPAGVATSVSGRNQQFTTTAGGPFPDFGVNRNNFYGFVNRDFFKVQQDIGTINAEVQITPDLTFSDKMRASRSVSNYIGTLPELPILTEASAARRRHSHRQSAEPLSDHRRRRQPDRGDLQVRRWRLEAYGAGRRRDLDRETSSRSTNIPG